MLLNIFNFEDTNMSWSAIVSKSESKSDVNENNESEVKSGGMVVLGKKTPTKPKILSFSDYPMLSTKPSPNATVSIENMKVRVKGNPEENILDTIVDEVDEEIEQKGKNVQFKPTEARPQRKRLVPRNKNEESETQQKVRQAPSCGKGKLTPRDRKSSDKNQKQSTGKSSDRSPERKPMNKTRKPDDKGRKPSDRSPERKPMNKSRNSEDKSSGNKLFKDFYDTQRAKQSDEGEWNDVRGRNWRNNKPMPKKTYHKPKSDGDNHRSQNNNDSRNDNSRFQRNNDSRNDNRRPQRNNDSRNDNRRFQKNNDSSGRFKKPYNKNPRQTEDMTGKTTLERFTNREPPLPREDGRISYQDLAEGNVPQPQQRGNRGGGGKKNYTMSDFLPDGLF